MFKFPDPWSLSHLLLSACAPGSVAENTTAETPVTTSTTVVPTTAMSVPEEILQAASDCVAMRIVGDALVLLAIDIDAKRAMAEALSTSEDAREMGIAMVESSTDLKLEADRIGELASFEQREDLAEVATWVESGLNQAAANYDQVVDALLDNDAEAMVAAVSDFDRIWPAILETIAAFAPILEDCPGAEADILQALDQATQ